jgi:hypothetical protein
VSAVHNYEVINAEHGVYSVLGLVSFALPGPYQWIVEDYENENSKGAIFRAYDSPDKDAFEVASIFVADATNDPTEPDVSTLGQDDIPSLDNFLREDIQTQMVADGRAIVEWGFSDLVQSEIAKALYTYYIVLDRGTERQTIVVRVKVKDRKMVAVGQYDIAKKEVLGVAMYEVMNNLSMYAPKLH